MSASDPLFDESDLEVAEYYCPHGTFIGNPYGADYMCGWCEDGTPWDEYLYFQAIQANRRTRANTAREVLATSFDGGFKIPELPIGYQPIVMGWVAAMARWIK